MNRLQLQSWVGKKEHRSGLWTVNESYSGECVIWVNEKGSQMAKAEDDSEVYGRIWKPSTNISQAFEVVYNLPSAFTLSLNQLEDKTWEACISNMSLLNGHCANSGDEIISIEEAKTPEMAICLAVLKAMKS